MEGNSYRGYVKEQAMKIEKAIREIMDSNQCGIRFTSLLMELAKIQRSHSLDKELFSEKFDVYRLLDGIRKMKGIKVLEYGTSKGQSHYFIYYG